VNGTRQVLWKPTRLMPGVCIYQMQVDAGGVELEDIYATQKEIACWLKVPIEGYHYFISSAGDLDGHVNAQWMALALHSKYEWLDDVLREKMEKAIGDLDAWLAFRRAASSEATH